MLNKEDRVKNIVDATLRKEMECPCLCPRCDKWVELDDMVKPVGIAINNEIICPECKAKQNEECLDCSNESDYMCVSCGYEYCYDCADGNIRKKCPTCGKFLNRLKGDTN